MSLCQPCATKHPPLSCSCFHPLPRPTKTKVRCPILESSSMVPWVAAAQRPLAKLTRATTCNTWILQQKLRQMFFLLNLPPSRWVSEIMSGAHLNCQWCFAYWSMMMIWNTAPGFTPVGPGEICGSTKGRFGVGGLSLSWGESWTTPPPMVQEEVEDSVPPVQVEDTVPPVQVSSLSVSWLLKIGVVGIGKILWRCKSNETDGCLIRKTTLVLNI